MPSSESHTLLVIPSYRESQRLPKFLPSLCEAVAAMEGNPVSVRVVDDGSGETEQKVVADLVTGLREDYPFLLEPLLREQNCGKGGAVYAGWDAAGENVNTLGFVDADGAVSAAEVVRVLNQIPGLNPDQCLYGARLHDGDQPVKRTFLRKYLGLLFRQLTHLFLRLPVRDTQCGLKFVPATSYRTIRDQLSETRYCFDIDLTVHLLRAGVNIVVVPISWTESPGTRLGILQASKMLGSLWQLRKKARGLAHS